MFSLSFYSSKYLNVWIFTWIDQYIRIHYKCLNLNYTKPIIICKKPYDTSHATSTIINAPSLTRRHWKLAHSSFPYWTSTTFRAGISTEMWSPFTLHRARPSSPVNPSTDVTTRRPEKRKGSTAEGSHKAGLA